MNKRLRVNGSAEGGFTLIELIVVIVILGILAATALPKFASLGGDARYASLQAVRGSLNSVSAMVHGKYLLSGGTTVSMEGTSVGISNGYPDVAATTATAAGIDTTNDYTVVPASTTGNSTNNFPTTTATQFAIIPKSIAGKTQGANCYVMYTAATASAPPTVSITGSSTACE